MTHYRPAAAVSLASDRHHRRLRRSSAASVDELATKLVLRSLARRIEAATLEADELERDLLSHVRAQHDAATKDYIARRVAEGKTRRDATRLLKRYLARHLYRVLNNQAPLMA